MEEINRITRRDFSRHVHVTDRLKAELGTLTAIASNARTEGLYIAARVE